MKCAPHCRFLACFELFADVLAGQESACNRPCVIVNDLNPLRFWKTFLSHRSSSVLLLNGYRHDFALIVLSGSGRVLQLDDASPQIRAGPKVPYLIGS
jgi:hypothetical protein